MYWAAEQPTWVKDSLRRIAVGPGHTLAPEDAACILENVRAANIELAQTYTNSFLPAK